MAYVINEKCIGTTDNSCVSVCPVDCIYEVGHNLDDPEKPLMLVIDPQECIDCGACEPACPVEAISYEDAMAEESMAFVAINAMHTAHPSDNDGPAPELRDAKRDIAEAAHSAYLGLVERGSRFES